MAQATPSNDSPTVDKTRTGKAKQGNNTVTDVPAAELQRDAKRVSKAGKRDTVEGKGEKPATSSGSNDVAPIVKQNQDTESPAISIVPPVYGFKGIKDVSKAKNDWEVAEAKSEARHGLEFLKTQNKEQRKQLVEEEYRRLHNGSLDEDVQTSHVSNQPLEYHGKVVPS